MNIPLLGIQQTSFSPLVNLFIFITVIGVVVIGYFLNQKRLKALQTYAESKTGFTYSSTTDYIWLSIIDVAPFKTFGEIFVTNREPKESISFQANSKPGVFFDYQYTTGSGKNRQVHKFKIAFIYTGINGARITLRQNNILEKVALLGKEIKFEDQDFNKKFAIVCDDQKFAYDAIIPETLKAIKDFNPAHLIWENNYLMYYASGSWTPTAIDSVFAGLTAIASQTPKSLIADSVSLPNDVYLPSDESELNKPTEYDKHHEEVSKIGKGNDRIGLSVSTNPDSYEAQALKKQEEIRTFENSGQDDANLTDYDKKQREVTMEENKNKPIDPTSLLTGTEEPLKPLTQPIVSNVFQNLFDPHNPLNYKKPDKI